MVALPNPQSIALHKAIGFAEVGVLKRFGYKFERYIDVGLWQLSIANLRLQAERTASCSC
jgi:L-amino acid N-acyltransferase YncA